MPKKIDEMRLDELLDLAEKNGMEPCDYCIYNFDCNHHAINCYGGNPIESPCVSDPDKWVDEDELRETLKDIIEEEATTDAETC